MKNLIMALVGLANRAYGNQKAITIEATAGGWYVVRGGWYDGLDAKADGLGWIGRGETMEDAVADFINKCSRHIFEVRCARMGPP